MVNRPLRLVAVCASPRFVPFLLPIWEHMHRSGHETHIVCGRDPQAALPRDLAPHQLHFVDIARPIAPALDVVCFSQLLKLFRRLRPDVVHAHGPKAGLLGMLSATVAAVPARIYSIHGLRHETLRGAKLRLVKRLEGLSASLAHRVICVSPSVQSRALAELPIDSSRTTVLCHGSATGVDAHHLYEPQRHQVAGATLRAALGIPSTAPVVGYVGRLAFDKGLMELTTAWESLSTAQPRWHLVIVGEADPTDPVDLQALFQMPRVHVLGHRRELGPIYAALDIVVLPSYREGFPQVLLEAAAMQVPVVATRVTGCVDAVVDGETGVLVYPRDPESLKAGIVDLLSDGARRQSMGEIARARVLRDFPVVPIAHATLDLYQELLANVS